jgi:hypothetical protein
MLYIAPGDVLSPKARLQLVKVLVDRGPDDAAYALANWDGPNPCIVFRWNGNDEQPIGNPQSRGLPTWVVLDRQLDASVIDLLIAGHPDLQAFARTFLGL